jgi:poly(3-hydroxybutyrate) depolymerase
MFEFVNKLCYTLALGVLMAYALHALPALAAAEQKTGRFGGLDISYRVLTPDDYDPSRSYPVVLHFAGGGQTWSIVERSTDADWRAHAEQRGIVVISPAAPASGLYFEDGDRIFPEFLDYIFANYNAAGGKLHVTGHSNGGLSAFHIASLYPDRFFSVTGYPGQLRRQDEARAAALRPLCIYMHAGERDVRWRDAMQAQSRTLAQRGYNIAFTIEPDQIHRLDMAIDNLGMRLFDELQRARNNCQQ